MKIGYKDISNSRCLSSLLLLVMVYFSQISPSYHFHHIHQDDLLGFEISAHPVAVDIEHSSDHHHEGDRPHPNGNQHIYDKHLDWRVIRPQTPKSITVDDHYVNSSSPFIFTDDKISSYTDYEDPLFINAHYASCPVIRGPPFPG